jgi:hypothetical protein
MNKMKMLAGMIVFGSLWGFSECIIGPLLADRGLPAGMLMTGLFAMVFLVFSRMMYQQKGMQVGMGLIAGSLRFFNPFGGCHLCSAIAIMAEGLLFECIWNYTTTLDLSKLNNLTAKVSLGIFSSYIVFIGGYIVTQALTPLISTGLFNITNLISFLPQIFARALAVALLGGVTVPITLSLKNIHMTLNDKYYYPATLGTAMICWILVLGNWIIYL